MKKEKTSKAQKPESDEMRPEYDFCGGVRGKHYQAYRRGHTVTIHKTDGSKVVQHFTLEDGAIMLEPDVGAYFPDSEAVNSNPGMKRTVTQADCTATPTLPA
jgi:hypothetical protein